MAGIVRRVINNVTTAPSSFGPYSQAVIVGNTMYCAGQIGAGIDKKLVPGGILPEFEQAMKNLGEILKSQGMNYSNIVKMTVLLANLDDFGKMNESYSKIFTSHHPARTAYQVARLPFGAQIEIEAIAVLGPIIDDASHL